MAITSTMLLKHLGDFPDLHLEDAVYKAMREDDLSEPVLILMYTMRFLKILPDLSTTRKCGSKSLVSSAAGDKAKEARDNARALKSYNEALLYAPYNSMEMRTAYDNRSLLFYSVGSDRACVRDIDVCLTLDCPPELIAKLENRRKDATETQWTEELPKSKFCEDFFRLDTTRSVDVPCACADVGVAVKSDIPKAVAVNDIKIGAVIAVETAFMSHTTSDNMSSMCYHCQKVVPNLFPCKGCTRALFCSEDCEMSSIKEYHNIECQLDCLDVVDKPDDFLLILKCVLKLRRSFSSWRELMDASLTMGAKRLAGCPIKAVFDGSNPYSILCCNKQRHFIHGRMFNGSVACAVILHYLTKLPSFFPKDNVECTAAMCAVARIMMHLHLYGTPMSMEVFVSANNKTGWYKKTNVGIFSFISKLNHSCNPNVKAVSIHNTVALVSVQPIKRGDELTLCYGHHFRENTSKFVAQKHRMNLLNFGILCDCTVCKGAWQLNRDTRLTNKQRKMINKIKPLLTLAQSAKDFSPQQVQDIFLKTSAVLAVLNQSPFSEQYLRVYEAFDTCILYLQSNTNKNYMAG